MSSINSSVTKSNVALLETESREMTAPVPPPPPPPTSLYDGQDYRATRGLDNLGRGRGSSPEAGLEDLDFLLEEEFAGWEEEPLEEEAPALRTSPQGDEGVETASGTQTTAAEETGSTQPEAPSAEEKQEFLTEISQAKSDFEETVQAVEGLSDTEKQSFIQKFNDRADALGAATDLEKAREELSNLPALLNKEIEATVEAAQEATHKARETLYQEMVQFTHAGRFRETQGHWWHKGIELGEKFLSALQTGNWNDFKTHLSHLEGNQRWVCVMRVVTAIYRTAGKDEGKAIQMLNNFVPKDVVQAMVDSVMSEPQNIDWGNGDRNECGPEGLVEWNIPGTADFLRRSLEARREDDPYAPISTPSTTTA